MIGSLRVLFAAIFASAAAAHAKMPGDLHAFADRDAWSAVASDQVDASLRASPDGRGLCLAFDFHGVSGYAAMRRKLPLDYPADYAFSFRMRGDAPQNALQFKLGDASGENVWWVNREGFEFPRAWTDMRYKKRQVAFAWGPTTDRTLRHSDTLEFTLYAGHGGRGEVCFDQLALRELPPEPATPAPIVAKASSALRESPASNAVDNDAASAWRSDAHAQAKQELTLDLGRLREFGGLVVHWAGDAYASGYDVALSDDRRRWRTVRTVSDGNGGIDWLYLPESEARYVRLTLRDGPAHAYAISDIEVRDLAFGASVNALFAAIAKQSPRGFYPRGFHDEQTYWTVVGVDGGHESGLLSEDGTLEVSRGGFSVEPFLVDDAGTITTWADVAITHSLEDRYLPLPSVGWQRDALHLTTTAFGARDGDATRLVAGYTVENRSDRARTITLALALRPFQVNPSVQFLNTPGGVSPIHELSMHGAAVSVDGKPRVDALVKPDAFATSTYDAGMIVEHLVALASGATPARTSSSRDETGLASGALLYRLQLAAHSSRTIALSIPLDGRPTAPPAGISGDAWFTQQRNAVAADWHRRLDEVGLRVPAQAQPLADSLRTALAHILISRDGAALRPGTRSYARSWIRDGAMISEALLRLGRADVARDYLDWFAPYQFANGKVPCCVDARGSDPVPENDSHGELIQLAGEIHRYTGDRALLERMWPHVDKAARYMDELRASESGETNKEPARAAMRGLMPASISHEGYSAKPMHSYWDDFWALAGYKSAVDIAQALGRNDDAARLRASGDAFRTDLYASLKVAVAQHAINYLPGCAELGDFDATSTTIALSPGGEQAALPQDLLHATFERYWNGFVARRDGVTAWKDYTPYEWRTVGAFVRLGWRERALAAIDFFMHDRRPLEWNQWAEVVGRDPRESRFIGDMPHGWVASDFIRSVLDLFAYERDADRALVLAAGVPDAWLDGEGIAIDGLRTPYGRLAYSLRREGTHTRLRIERSDLRMPPGGLVFTPAIAATHARLDGKRINASNGEFRIASLPAELVIENAAANKAR
jgi:hypothetical protein